jgi:dolichol-phosphate mannosyltransferase
MIDGQQIAVVIPCYRVRDHIAAAVADLPAFVDAIILVNDACPHGSAEAIAQLHDPRVVVLTHEVNQGVGGAMITGLQYCKERPFHIVVKYDGDGQMSGADLPRLIHPLLAGRADYSKGNRWVRTTELKQMPLLRRIGNIGISFLAKAASGYWNVFDVNNGYVAIGRTALDLIEFHRISKRYFFENSMLIHLNIIRAVVVDIPLRSRYGTETSSLSLSRTFIEFPLHLLRGFLRRIWWRHFVFDLSLFAIYLLVGLFLLTFGVAFGAYQWWLSAKTGIPATGGTVMLAGLPVLAGLQMLMQAVLIDIVAVPTRPLAEDDVPATDCTPPAPSVP